MSAQSVFTAQSAYQAQVCAFPPRTYGWWCCAWYVVWVAVAAVVGYFLQVPWWQGIIVGLVTGAPLLLRLRQPAWLGLYALESGNYLVVGGYTHAANWSTPLQNIIAVRPARTALTPQLHVLVAERSAVQLYNRKGLSRGALRENAARHGAAIEMDFLGAAAVTTVAGWLAEAAPPAG